MTTIEQSTEIDKSNNTNQKLIQFKEYKLNNGLKVILYPNTKAPIVHVLVWYHVGSKNESPNRTGFAHLFEHLMFEGSQNIPKSYHAKFVQNAGGVLNGTTSFDRTNYYETLPSENLELGLWLEADRMRALNLNQENFDNQRAVVSEEYKQNYVNEPYGMTFKYIAELIFSNTNYAWIPIGNMEQLAQAVISEVQDFHKKYYAPNNATLVLSGDFEIETAERMVNAHFSDIPKGDEIEYIPNFNLDIKDQRRFVLYDNVPAERVYVIFKGVDMRHVDSEALNILTMIMDEGRSSRLQSNLVYNNSPLASSIGGDVLELEKAGAILFTATCANNVSAQEVEKKIFEEIENIKSHGITQHELDKCINSIETWFSNNHQYLFQVANSLAYNSVFFNDTNRVNSMLEKYQKITIEDIQRIANEYLKPNQSCVLYILPHDKK